MSRLLERNGAQSDETGWEQIIDDIYHILQAFQAGLTEPAGGISMYLSRSHSKRLGKRMK